MDPMQEQEDDWLDLISYNLPLKFDFSFLQRIKL
jgi:hypothetical protein